MQILEKALSSLGLPIDTVFNSAIILILIFTFSLIGSYLHELFFVIRDKTDKIEIDKIMLTCITYTIALFYFSDKIILISGYKGVMLVSFVAGAAGYKSVYYFYSGKAWSDTRSRFNIGMDKKDNNIEEDEEEE